MDFNTLRLMMGASGGAPKVYVEDVFSTWLYTGNGSTQTITNGIDLSGKGGLVWIKGRSGTYGNSNHRLYDTARGATNELYSNLTFGQYADSTTLTSFSSSGFSVSTNAEVNGASTTFASWTFRKAAKFFDVVTYTGTGSAQAVSHNLGTAPGFIVAKQTNNTSDWIVYHRSSGATKVLTLNSTGAEFTAGHWDNTTPTSTQFYVGGGGVSNNLSGGTYVAYLFAHDAGGFGDSGNDNVISCGSFVHTNGTVPSISLGYEPQWVLIKNATGAGSWLLFDNMRGMPVGSSDPEMYANSSAAESNTTDWISPNATGFTLPYFSGLTSNTFIYIAIRRGPMKTPTDATKVFDAETTAVYPVTWSNGFPLDMMMTAIRGGNIYNHQVYSRLISGNFRLVTSSTAAQEDMGGVVVAFDKQDSVTLTLTSSSLINYSFRRAPGFFDVVAYTGTGVARTVSHNLGVVPELMIIKQRNGVANWKVYSSSLGVTNGIGLNMNVADEAGVNVANWNNTSPTSLNFSVGVDSELNASGSTYIAYLFASCLGVSKCGSYTGTGTTLNVNCGFTNGARFVLIKRTDSTGDWFVWDTARGIIAANDPYLLLNSTAAEVTNTDYIDPLSSGFQISSTAPAAINANGGSFIFLAIA